MPMCLREIVATYPDLSAQILRVPSNDLVVSHTWSLQFFGVATPAEPRGEKKLFFCANSGR